MSQYTEQAKVLGELVESKQAAYGHSYERAGEVLCILYPNGVQPGQYQDFLAVVRVVDKLFRIATYKGTQESPWQDIAGYGLLGVCHGRSRPTGSAPSVTVPQEGWNKGQGRLNPNDSARKVEAFEVLKLVAMQGTPVSFEWLLSETGLSEKDLTNALDAWIVLRVIKRFRNTFQLHKG